MSGALRTGHRGKGSGYNLDSVPEIERAIVLSRHKGTVWYVNSGAAAGGNGTSWDSAYTTLEAAKAQAAPYDTILIAPGHAENITGAATIALSKALTIVGLGNGRARPTFTWTTATTATITIAGSNVWISNCVFIGTGFDAIVTMFAVTGDDVTFQGCEFDIANATNQVSLGITVTSANRFRMFDCHVHGTNNAGCTNFVQIVGGAGKQLDYEFSGCTFIGAFTTSLGVINNITVAMVNMIVRNCVMVNLTASATKCIVTLTGSTGVVMQNTFGIGSGAAPVTMDAGWWAGNWSAAAVATNGTLV